MHIMQMQPSPAEHRMACIHEIRWCGADIESVHLMRWLLLTVRFLFPQSCFTRSCFIRCIHVLHLCSVLSCLSGRTLYFTDSLFCNRLLYRAHISFGFHMTLSIDFFIVLDFPIGTGISIACKSQQFQSNNKRKSYMYQLGLQSLFTRSSLLGVTYDVTVGLADKNAHFKVSYEYTALLNSLNCNHTSK